MYSGPAKFLNSAPQKVTQGSGDCYKSKMFVNPGLKNRRLIVRFRKDGGKKRISFGISHGNKHIGKRVCQQFDRQGGVKNRQRAKGSFLDYSKLKSHWGEKDGEIKSSEVRT